MDIAIIIINFRTPEVTLNCLRSLADIRNESPNCQVVVLENGSGDDSEKCIQDEIIRRVWGNWVTILRSESNLGFAGGNNLCIRWVLENMPQTSYVVLLNSDTIVQLGVLSSCQKAMEAEKSIGVMSCQLLNRDGSIQNVTRRFPSPHLQTLCSLGLPWKWPKLFGWANIYDVPAEALSQKRDCEWIGGAFMFIRREAFNQVGFLDESFFFYGEDIEYCYRFHQAGYRVHYDPAGAITHLGGGSSDPTRIPLKARNKYMWQARYLVQKKCYGNCAAWWIRFVDIFVMSARKLKLLCMGQRHSSRYAEVSEILSVLMRKLGIKS